MSRAFVKEQDGDVGEGLPELVVSPHRNLVTPDGLVQMEARLRQLDAELAGARAADDRAAIARIERDRRYWSRRRGSAECVPWPRPPVQQARFGCLVTLEDAEGRRHAFRIVGEDEADPSAGLVSWVSPLAETLLGARVGDTLDFRGGQAEVVSIA